jgi:DNA-binding transcriptional regulator YhcF (GntR family)
MIVINYSTSFKALDNYILHYNNSTDQLSEKIRQGAAASAKDIIRIYGLFLVKANGVNKLSTDNLPPIRTNNVQLAKMANASPRTIQRHIIRLQEAGIITNKIWHGSNLGYDLFINPKILLAKCRKTQKETKKSLDNALKQSIENDMVTEINTTSCRHTDSCNNRYKLNNLLIGGDNKLKRSSLSLTSNNYSGYETGNKKTGNTGEKIPKKNEDAGEKMRKKRAENQRFGEVKSPDLDPARSASLNLYVSLLWGFAKSMLYSGIYLTERQEEVGKKLLYDWYAPVPTKNLSKVHQIYVDRIGLARKFIEKDPEKRFIQLPFKYFDTNNLSGFAGTKKWWADHEKRKKEVRAKLILHAQIRRFINNQKKDSSKQKPPLQLYQECETRVGKLGNPILLEQFHAAILNPKIHQHLYINN